MLSLANSPVKQVRQHGTTNDRSTRFNKKKGQARRESGHFIQSRWYRIGVRGSRQETKYAVFDKGNQGRSTQTAKGLKGHALHPRSEKASGSQGSSNGWVHIDGKQTHHDHFGFTSARVQRSQPLSYPNNTLELGDGLAQLLRLAWTGKLIMEATLNTYSYRSPNPTTINIGTRKSRIYVCLVFFCCDIFIIIQKSKALMLFYYYFYIFFIPSSF
ncbi:unnamed protein product [Absidia cylindrospora]